MANLSGLVGIVAELREERTNLVSQLKQVDVALSVLGGLNVSGSSTLNTSTGKRIVSAAARKKMSLAQKARWSVRSASVARPKRVMSASSRRKIAAAQRARWAKVKAGKKIA